MVGQPSSAVAGPAGQPAVPLEMRDLRARAPARLTTGEGACPTIGGGARVSSPAATFARRTPGECVWPSVLWPLPVRTPALRC